MFTRIIVAAVIVANSAIALFAQGQPANKEKESQAIKTEIERITQAFIDRDIETIYKTHSQDWSGFLNDSQTEPIYGIDAYMKANGIPWPAPAGYKPTPDPKRHFTITNFLVDFVTQDVGVASFTLDFPWQDGVHFNRLRIMDVFAKRGGTWIQTASYTVLDPAWKAEQATLPTALSAGQKKHILDAREAVWRAWFANDRTKLDAMIPDEAITIDGPNVWRDRAAVFADAKQFAESGEKLTRLEFPKTEIQLYGNTIILYTTYLFETEKDGKKQTSTGSGVETFVRRGDQVVNTGWLLSADHAKQTN